MKLCPKCEKQFPDDLGFCPHDGTVLAEDHTALIGRVLDGQYEIEAFIAAGGMGAVYRARHILLGDTVAIKILPTGMRQNAEWLKRFQREGQAARRFRHPNAVVVHDLRTSEDGLIYLVMEFVAGITLDEMLHQSGRITPAAGLPIIEAVASVLDAAHAQGVVHRDLKPSNIMITNDGMVKLLDLGIAKIRDLTPDQAGLTTEGQFLGTPYFMSPEQWGEIPRDGGHEIDGRADIYSLGVVVYQMTAGALPFPGNTTLEVRRAHMTKPPRPLAELNLNIPPAWSQVVLQALSKDRAHRQATAGEFARDLHAATEGADRLETPRSTAPTLLNTGTASLAGANTAVTDAATGSISPSPNTLDPTTRSVPGAQPARSWTMSLMQNRGCRVSLTVAAMLVIAVGAGIPLLMYSLNNGSRPTASNSNPLPTLGGGNANQAPSNTNANPNGQNFGDVLFNYVLSTRNAPFDDPATVPPGQSIRPGQFVEFELQPRSAGLFYLFGHDDGGNSVVIPLDPLDGKVYVELSPGVNVTVPALPVLKVRGQPGKEVFTVVYSTEPLDFLADSPEGLAGGGMRKLSPAELQKLNDLRPSLSQVFLKPRGNVTEVSLSQSRPAQGVLFDIDLTVAR